MRPGSPFGLGIMVQAGVPLTQALEGLQAQSDRANVQEALQAILADVRNGGDLSGAIARCPYQFPPIFAKLLRAAEASGRMGPMLSRVAEYLELEVEALRKVRAAMAYPMVMLSLGVVAVGLIFGFLLPRFEIMYKGRQAILPLPTKIALAISHFLRDHWVLLGAGAAVAVVGIIVYLRTSHGRQMTDWLKLHIPLINRMYRQFYVSRSFQTIGTMIAGGVTVPEAVRLSRDIAGNSYFTQPVGAGRGAPAGRAAAGGPAVCQPAGVQTGGADGGDGGAERQPGLGHGAGGGALREGVAAHDQDGDRSAGAADDRHPGRSCRQHHHGDPPAGLPHHQVRTWRVTGPGATQANRPGACRQRLPPHVFVSRLGYTAPWTRRQISGIMNSGPPANVE